MNESVALNTSTSSPLLYLLEPISIAKLIWLRKKDLKPSRTRLICSSGARLDGFKAFNRPPGWQRRHK